MNRVVHFEIHADDPERAIGFYTNVFGWKIEKRKAPVDYWLVDTGEGFGINGAIKWRIRPAVQESIMSFVCTIEVSSIEEIDKKIMANGGDLIMPKTEIPGIGWHAYYKDTEGNMFGIVKSV